jgi:hypothetical protein
LVNPVALIALEKSAARALHQAIEPEARRLAADVARAINCKKVDEAIGLLEGFDPHPAIKKSLPAYRQIAVSAAILGASQLVKSHETMFTRGHGLDLLFESADNMAKVAGEIAQNNVRRLGARALTGRGETRKSDVTRHIFKIGCCSAHMMVRRAEVVKAGTITLSADATLDQYADALNAATLSGSRLAADTAANLTTTRLTAYGFLAQARQNGVTRYQVSSILDDRTCPVCMYMNGKEQGVDESFDRVSRGLREKDSSKMADILPWPGQSKADVADLFTMDPAELQKRGFTVPFHPGCRCILVPVGTVDETIRPQEKTQAEHIVQPHNWLDTLLSWLTDGSHGSTDAPDPPDDLFEDE